MGGAESRTDVASYYYRYYLRIMGGISLGTACTLMDFSMSIY